MMQYRLLRLLVLGLALLGLACGSGPLRQVPPEVVSASKPTVVESVLLREGLFVQWQAAGYYDGSLVSAIVNRSANSTRRDEAQAYADRLRPELAGFDFQNPYWQGLGEVVREVEWLKVARFEPLLTSPASSAPFVAQNRLRIGTDFVLVPNLAHLVVSSGYRFIPAGDEDTRVTGMVYYYSAPIGAMEDEAVPLWKANRGERMRQAIEEGSKENRRLLGMALRFMGGEAFSGLATTLRVDLVNARGDFGITSRPDATKGQVLDVRPDRITFQSEEGHFYSLPIASIKEAKPAFKIPPPAPTPPAPTTPPLAPPPPQSASPEPSPAAPPVPSAPQPPPEGSPGPPEGVMTVPDPNGAPASEVEATPSPPIECQPACREDMVCVRGQCVSACNPPCSPGFVCDAGRRCVDRRPATLAWEAEMRRNQEAEQRRLEEEQRKANERESAKRERLQSRLVPRWTTDLAVGRVRLEDVSQVRTETGSQEEQRETDVVFATMFSLTSGYRRSLDSWWGIAARATAQLGPADDPGEDSDDSSEPAEPDVRLTTMYGLSLEVAPYLGPFGRFYFGPVLGGSYLHLPNGTVDGRELWFEQNHFFGAYAGLGAGFLLLTHEQLDINLQLVGGSAPRFAARLGIGWHFLL